MDSKTNINETNNEHSENKQEYIYEEYIDTGNFPLLGCVATVAVILLYAFIKSLIS